MSGYVPIYRSIEESGFLEDGPLLQVFMKAMIESTYKERTRMVQGFAVELSPGEFIFGRKAWAEALGLSEKVVRNRIGTLQKRATIRATRKASKFTVFKFVNWDTYKLEAEEEGPAEGPAEGPTKGQQGASKGPHDNKGRKKEGKKKKEENPSDSCAEPVPDSPPEAVVATLPLNDGSEFPVTENFQRELSELYPAVDVEKSFRDMRGWLIGNPTKKKTRTGVKRFITGWLSREQDRGGNRPPALASPHQQQQPRATTQAQKQAQDRDKTAQAILAARRQREYAENQSGQNRGGAGGAGPCLPGGDDQPGTTARSGSRVAGGPRALDGGRVSDGGC